MITVRSMSTYNSVERSALSGGPRGGADRGINKLNSPPARADGLGII